MFALLIFKSIIKTASLTDTVRYLMLSVQKYTIQGYNYFFEVNNSLVTYYRGQFK